MSTIARELTDIQGVAVAAPTQNGYSATAFSAYADDAAFVTANGAATTGDAYWNTTSLVVRQYDGTAWQNNKVHFSTETNAALTGSDQDYTPGRDQIVTFTDASLASIRSISPAVQKFMILINATGTSMDIKNEDAGATAANRIMTGTGLDLTLDSGASILVAYNTNASRWQVIGGTGSGGSSSSDDSNINLCTSPSTVVNWVSSAATAATTTTTAAECPLYPLVATAIKITRTTVGSYDAWRWQMPESLKNNTIPITIHQLVESGFATGDFKLDVYTYPDNTYASGTRKALRSDSSSVTSIPAMNGFFGSGNILAFDAADEDYYEMRITRVAGTNWMSIAGVKIGFGSVGVAPSDGFWESTTSFTVGATTTAPTPHASTTYYRETNKQGAFAIIRFEIRQTSAGTGGSGDYLLPLPTGLTIDYARVSKAAAATSLGDVGGGTLQSTATYIAKAYTFDSGSYADKIYVSISGDVTAPGTAWGSVNASFANATTILSLTVRVPIEGWQDSVLVGPGNDIEYVSNTSTTASNDTTSFAYGKEGSLIPSITASAVAGTWQKRVQFQTPIQSDDIIIIEVNGDGGSTQWEEVGISRDYQCRVVQNSGTSVAYGMSWTYVPGSSTQIDITFGKGGAVHSGNGYGSAGNDWPVTAGDLYRVRKTRAGIPAGLEYGQTHGGAQLYKAGYNPGLTTGANIGSGYVGERLKSQLVRSSATNITAIANIVQITLTAGIWQVFGLIGVAGNSTSVTILEVAVSTASGSITDPPATDGSYSTSSSPVLGDVSGVSLAGGTILNNGDFVAAIPTFIQNISSDKTLYLVARATGANGTATGYGRLEAIRIA